MFVPTQPWPRLARFIEHTIELPVAEVHVKPENERRLREALADAIELGKGVVHLVDGLDSLERAVAGQDPSLVAMTESVYSVKRACPSCSRSFPELDPRLFSFNSKHGWCAACYGTGLQIDEVEWDEERQKTGAEDHVLDSWLEWLEIDETCPECDGRRLNREALAVRYRDKSIAELTALPVAELAAFFRDVTLAGREVEIARDIVPELRSRLGFLEQVGLGYLALDRARPTLSGGEAQRIRLAAQLGSNLRGVCYILDEPTIGLHPRDNRVLLDALERLEAKGQHAHRRRARRRHDTPRRARDRPRPRRRQARRRGDRRRHGRRPHAQPPIGDRALSRAAAQASAASAARGRSRHARARNRRRDACTT